MKMNQAIKHISWKTGPLMLLLLAGSAAAAVMTGLNSNMQSQVFSSGGPGSSTNFALTGSVGEGTAGAVASSTNFTLRSGFIPTLNVPPPLPQIGLVLNGSAFNSTTNSTLTLTASTVQSAPVANADVYVALQLPDGTLLAMQPGGGFSTALTPLVANIPIPDFNGIIFNYAFTGVEPVGNYTWFAALTTPGTLNIIGTLATSPFSFAP